MEKDYSSLMKIYSQYIEGRLLLNNTLNLSCPETKCKLVFKLIEEISQMTGVSNPYNYTTAV